MARILKHFGVRELFALKSERCFLNLIFSKIELYPCCCILLHWLSVNCFMGRQYPIDENHLSLHIISASYLVKGEDPTLPTSDFS